MTPFDISGEYVKDMKISGVSLSDKLYINQQTIAKHAKQIINDHFKEGGTIKKLATKLYEGYNFKDDPLKIKKGLPNYLIKEVNELSVKMAHKLKTPALKASYLELLSAKSEIEYQKKLKQAVYERNRYYANRIAQTETFRAYSEAEAKMQMEDKELTTIKIKMSASHPREDICDYHATVNLYGLGAGVYPKAKAPLPPFHPWCRCRTLSKHSIDSSGAKLNPTASKEMISKFPLHVQKRIIGSEAKLERFNRGESIESILNDGVSQPYRVRYVGDVVGYNGGMKPKFTSNILDDDEKKYLKEWTSDSSRIKLDMWNERKLEATLVLFGLFAKYKSNVPKDAKLYRGMSFDYDTFVSLGFGELRIGDEITPDNKAISSFSYDKNTAYEYAEKANRPYKIGYIMSSNNGNVLDITEFSAKANDKETILAKSIWYRIDAIKEFKTEDGLWKILKISPVE